MFRAFRFTLALCSFSLALSAQTIEYRSAENPHYWKNRSPFAGYWQQDVYYRLNATLDDGSQEIKGNAQITYFNNSPDTLFRIYFHLYQNAFQPESYHHSQELANGVQTQFGPNEAQKNGTRIHQISANGKNLTLQMDNTIAWVDLLQPLLPQQSIDLNIDFSTWFDSGSMRRRMKVFTTQSGKNIFKHFDGVHWYPRIAVYDRKFGWETDQHLGREFYGDFGTYELSLTLPSHYIVEATGQLLNENEVLPTAYRQKIDISNFKTLPPDYYKSNRMNEVNLADGKQKTWKFRAINVHDMAWTADPLYRIGETKWNGIRCISVAQEPNAPGWQDASEICAKVIQIYSEDFGMYVYPKMVVADARDGMEYPMLTLNSGRSPYYQGVIAHEVAHNWFFGMVGSNETYRAALDEGFTQFLENWSLPKAFGIKPPTGKTKPAFLKKHIENPDRIESRLFAPYIYDLATFQDAPLNTHSDHFGGALGHGGGYRLVYYKTASMLKNLQYVLGDQLFIEAMQHYVNQWKIAHPYVEDFRNSIIQFTHVDLNWFFDQWLEGTHAPDYAIKKVKRKGKNKYTITIERKGEMIMPLDIRIGSKNDTQEVYIPISYFNKKTKAQILKPWIGWDNIQNTYAFDVQTQGKLKYIEIDPSHRLADKNYLDNIFPSEPITKLDLGLTMPLDPYHYRVYMRPEIWGNSMDGLKIGYTDRGSYMRQRYAYQYTFWYNTGWLNKSGMDPFPDNPDDWFHFKGEYRDLLSRRLTQEIKLQWLDGLALAELKYIYRTFPGWQFETGIRLMNRPDARSQSYVLNYMWGNTNNIFGFVSASKQKALLKGKLQWTGNIYARSTLAWGNPYAYLRGISQQSFSWKKMEFKSRLFGQWGSQNINPESRLMMAGANAEELSLNKFTRAPGFIPESWRPWQGNIGHFHQGGGLNLRGYAQYLAPQLINGNIIYTFSGNSGMAANLEIDFDALIKTKPKGIWQHLHLDAYGFADIGFIRTNPINAILYTSDIRADAGIGFALTIRKFWFVQDAKPFTIRADFPLFLSHAPAASPENFSLSRWVIGLNRAF